MPWQGQGIHFVGEQRTLKRTRITCVRLGPGWFLAAPAINYLYRLVFTLCCSFSTSLLNNLDVLYSLATDVRRLYGPIPLINPHSLAENPSLFFCYPTTTLQYQFYHNASNYGPTLRIF